MVLAFNVPAIPELGTASGFDMFLTEANITWHEKNLPDLYLQIDIKESVVSVQVDYWDETPLEYDL